MAPPKQKNRGISRIDSGKTHGYLARVYHQGQVYSRFFADREYRGKRASMEAASKHNIIISALLEQGALIVPEEQRNSRYISTRRLGIGA